MEMPDKRKRILRFIQEFMEEHDYAPSLREIQKACRISSISMVEFHLKALEREGYIRRHPEVDRGLVVFTVGRRAVPVPLLGTIAAGEPIPVPGEDTWRTVPEEVIEVPRGMVSGLREVYALKVRGTSMVDALIADGDIVLMEHVSTAEDGDIVAVWMKDKEEATLKRVYWEGQRVRLQPANPLMQPIYAEAKQVQVQGRVVGIMRYFIRPR